MHEPDGIVLSTGEGRIALPSSVWPSLRAWRATRLSWMRFGPLALLVAWAASLGAAFDGHAFALRLALAFMLIAQFRLWDDLADRVRDRVAHPNRVLPRTEDVRAFVAVCVAVGGMNALALGVWRGPAAVVGLGLLIAGLGVWYRLHVGRGAVHAHVLLLKYPAFVWLLASPTAGPWTIGLAAAAVYAAICAFELLDMGDTTQGRTVAFAAHGCVLTIATCAPSVDATGLAAGLLVAVIHAMAWLADGRRFTLPGRRYWPFIAAVVVLFRLSLGGNA